MESGRNMSSRQKSTSALQMERTFEEMRVKEARSFLQPYLKAMKAKQSSGGKGESSVRKRDLQKLACYWKLNQIPGFWAANPDEDSLLATLYKHAKKLEAEKKLNPGNQPEEFGEAKRVHSTLKVDHRWENKVAVLDIAKLNYKGDLFGTRGNYTNGIIYASRRPGSSIETRNGNSNKVHGLHRKNSNDLDTSQKSDSDVSDEVDESPALEELRLNSSTTLAEISSQEEMKPKLATFETIQTLYETYNTISNRQIKRNCALTLANLYSSLDIAPGQDDLLIPIIWLCAGQEEAEVFTTCAKAILRRLRADRPLDKDYVKGIVAAVSNIENRNVVDTKARRIIAEAIFLMLDRCQDTGDEESVFWSPNSPSPSRRRNRRKSPFGSKTASKDRPKSPGSPETEPQLSPIRIGGSKEDPEFPDGRDEAVYEAVREGVLPLLVSMAGTTDDKIKEFVALSFFRISNLVSTHGDLGGRLVLPAIISLLHGGTPTAMNTAAMLLFKLVMLDSTAQIYNMQIVVDAMVAVALRQSDTLEKVGDNQEERIRCSIPEFNFVDLARQASTTFLHLSRKSGMIVRLLQAGAADALFVWASSKDQMIHRNAILTLCFFYEEESIRTELVELGFIETMVEALNEPMDLYEAPAKYASPLEAEGRLASSRGRSEEDELSAYDVKNKIATCLLSLTVAPSASVVAELAARDCVRAFVVWYEKVKDLQYPYTAVHSAARSIEALANLAKFADMKPDLAKKETIDTLIEACQAKNEEVATRALTALSLLAAYAPAHEALLEGKLIPTLGALADVPEKKQPIVSSMCELSHYRDFHDAMLKQGVIPLLVAQSRVNDATIRRQCAQALYNLSCAMDADREYQMVRSQVSESLTIIALFRADDELTKDLCAAALYNMLFNPIGRLEMINNGVLWALIKLATPHGAKDQSVASPSSHFPTDDPRSSNSLADVRYTCTRVIRNLACDPVLVDQLGERRILSALETFASASDHATRLNCAVAVAEACRRPNLHKPLLAHGVLEVLLALAKGRDAPVAHRVAISALRLSQKPDSRQFLADNFLVFVAVIGTLLRSSFPSVAESIGLQRKSYVEYDMPDDQEHDPSKDILVVRTAVAAVIALANVSIVVPQDKVLAISKPEEHVRSWVRAPDQTLLKPRPSFQFARSLSIPSSISGSNRGAAISSGFSSDAETKRIAKEYSVLQRLFLVLQIVLKIACEVPDMDKVQGMHFAIPGSDDGLARAVPVAKEEKKAPEKPAKDGSDAGSDKDSDAYSDEYSDDEDMEAPAAEEAAGARSGDDEADVQSSDLQDPLGDFAASVGPRLFLVDAVIRCLHNSLVHLLPLEGLQWLAGNEPEAVAQTLSECFTVLDKVAPKSEAAGGNKTAEWNTSAGFECVRSNYIMLAGAAAWLATHPDFASALFATDILEQITKIADQYPTTSYLHKAAASVVSCVVFYQPRGSLPLSVLQRLCRLMNHAAKHQLHSVIAHYITALHTLASPLSAPYSARFNKGALGSEDVEETERREKNLGLIVKAGFVKPLTRIILASCKMRRSMVGPSSPGASPSRSDSPGRITLMEGDEDPTFWSPSPEEKKYIEELLHKAAEFLYELVGVADLREQFVADGGLLAVVALANTKITSIELQMIDVTLRLSANAAFKGPMLEAKVGPTLSTLASKSGVPKGIQDKCAEALRNLSADDPTQQAGGSVVDSVLMLLPGAPVREVDIAFDEEGEKEEELDLAEPETMHPRYFNVPRPVLPSDAEAPVPATVEQCWLRYSSSGEEHGRVPPLEEGVAEYADELKALLRKVDPKVVYSVLGLDKGETVDVESIDGIQLITGSVQPDSPYFDTDRLHNWNKILAMEGPPVPPEAAESALAEAAMSSPFHVALGDHDGTGQRRNSRYKGLSRPLFISAEAVQAASNGMRERRKVITITSKPPKKKTWRMARSLQSLPPLNPPSKTPELAKSETVLVLSSRPLERKSIEPMEHPQRNRQKEADPQEGVVLEFNRRRKPATSPKNPTFRPGKPPSVEDTLKNSKVLAGKSRKPKGANDSQQHPAAKQGTDLSPYFPQSLPSLPAGKTESKKNTTKTSTTKSAKTTPAEPEREALWKQLEEDLARSDKLAAHASRTQRPANAKPGSRQLNRTRDSASRPRTTASSDGEVIPISDGIIADEEQPGTPKLKEDTSIGSLLSPDQSAHSLVPPASPIQSERSSAKKQSAGGQRSAASEVKEDASPASPKPSKSESKTKSSSRSGSKSTSSTNKPSSGSYSRRSQKPSSAGQGDAKSPAPSPGASDNEHFAETDLSHQPVPTEGAAPASRSSRSKHSSNRRSQKPSSSRSQRTKSPAAEEGEQGSSARETDLSHVEPSSPKPAASSRSSKRSARTPGSRRSKKPSEGAEGNAAGTADPLGQTQASEAYSEDFEATH